MNGCEKSWSVGRWQAFFVLIAFFIGCSTPAAPDVVQRSDALEPTGSLDRIGGASATLDPDLGPLFPLSPSRPADEPRDAIAPSPGMSVGTWVDGTSLEVAPAPNGSEPALALATNHLVSDGILGAGYQLEGLSSIVRRTPTGAVPSADSTDGYFLDGKRLIVVEAALSNPLNPISAYQPEAFDGSQLEYDAVTNTWTLGREGWTFVYGSKLGTGTSATRLFGTNTRANTTEWLLSRAEDPHHNVITYSYQTFALPNDIYAGYPGVTTGEHLIDVIRYNGGAARVEFSYSARPDPQLSYASGAPTFSTQRLHEIVSYGRNNAEYSRYRIEYKDEGGADCDGNAVTGVDQLDSPLQTLVRRIVRIGTAGHADAGRERVLRCITTHHESVAWEDAVDVSLDVPMPLGSSVPTNTLLPVPLHLDGDGVTDLVLLGFEGGASPDAHHQAFRATPRNAKAFDATGSAVEDWAELLTDLLPWEHFEEHRGFAFTDLNRDGFTDFVYETIPSGGGKGIVKLARWEPNFGDFSFSDLDVLACDLRNGQFADVNGDGFPDLVRLARAADDDCIERDSEWLENSGLIPWLERGNANDAWRPLATPANDIVAAATITPPDFETGWNDEQYVEGQARLLDLNADGLVDLTYTLWREWREVCEPDDALDCWHEPDWSTHYSRIYWGNGHGSFLDSGLAGGGPVLTRRTGVSAEADSRILNATQTAVDFMRGGRPQLITTYNTSSNAVFGAKWRGIRLGFGDEPVTGVDAQEPWAVYPDFHLDVIQQPGLGDACFSNSTFLTYGDFDGDGFTDLLSFNLSETKLAGCASNYCVKLTSNARGTAQGRITASDNAWGGRTRLTWGSSADLSAGNHSVDFPGAVEVLTEIDGQNGEVELHYAYPTQTQGRFQGFGLVEREGARGGLERFAFGVTPALAGKLLYAARFRSDNTLEHATVFAYAGTADAGCLNCVQQPPFGNPSSYALDLSPPFANLPVRQCDYAVERAALGDGGRADVPGLIEHCYRWDGRAAPAATQLLAAAGLYRYPKAGWPAFALSSAAWRDEDRTLAPLAHAIQLSTEDEPDGDHAELWSFSALTSVTTGGREITARWTGPSGAPLPPPADLEELAILNEQAAGAGFSAYVVDRTYSETSRQLSEEYLHRDVLTTADDLHRVNTWVTAPRPTWTDMTLPFRRLQSTTLLDASGAVLGQLTRDDFDPAHADRPRRVTRCGTGGLDCRSDTFVYHANGHVASHTRPDLAVATFSEAPFCGTETTVDAGGRIEVRTYDNLCRLTRRSFRGVVTTWQYDGQNRTTRRTVAPNGGGPTTTIVSTQPDQFAIAQDELYQEPRLRELREQDGRLWLTYLDDFGRVTKRVACQVGPGRIDLPSVPAKTGPVLPPACAPGPKLVLEHNLWGTDGLLFAGARPYLETGPNAETPAFTVTTHDGMGRAILTREPANVDLASASAAWTSRRTWYAPGRLITKDALGRVSVTEQDTLHRSLTVDAQLVASVNVDALGLTLSALGSDGVEFAYTYTPHHRVQTESRVATAESIVDGDLVSAPWVRQHFYDTLDRPIRVREPDGTATEMTWDALGRPLRVQHVDSSGTATTLKTLTYFTASSGVDEITETDEIGHRRVHHLDGLGRVLDENDWLGTLTSWRYGANDRPSSKTETSGALRLTTSYSYDLGDRLAARTDPDGGVFRNVYNGAGGILERTTPPLVRTTTKYLFSGRPFESRLDTSGGSYQLERTKYDAAGRPREQHALGVRRRFFHDSLDRLVREIVGEQDVFVETSFVYDGTSDRPTEQTRVGSSSVVPARTTWGYDAWGRARLVESPDGDVRQFLPDVLGRLRFDIDADGFRRESRYDDRGRVVYQSGAGRSFETTSYEPAAFTYQDGVQQPNTLHVTTTDAAGATAEQWQDGAGRVVARKRADGTRVERRYAGRRLTDELVVGASGAVLAQSRTTYLANGVRDGTFGPDAPAAFAAFDPDNFTGPRVRYGVAPGGRLDWIDAAGERTSFEYGSDGLLQREQFRGLTRTFLRRLDPADPTSHPRVTGETLGRVVGAVRRTNFDFDAVGRLTRRSVTDGAALELSAWEDFDADGRPRRERTTVAGALQVEHVWQWSLGGRPLSRLTTVATEKPRQTRWTWRASGARSSVIGPNGDGFVYDYGPKFDGELDEVKRISGASVARVELRDPRGLPTRVRIGTGGTLELEHDLLGRTTRVERRTSSGELELETATAYDEQGRIAREEFTDPLEAWANEYDYSPAGHLLVERRTRGGAVETLTYSVNAAGYRTETVGTLDGVSQALTTTYDPAFPVERLLSVTTGGVTKALTYDTWDSVLTDQYGNRFTYTPSGELATATVASTARTYFRDPAGVPWGERVGKATRLVTWDLDPAARPLQVDDPSAGIFAYAELGDLHVGRLEYPSATLQSQSAGQNGTLLAEGASGRPKGSAFGVGIAPSPARGERMLYAGLEAVPGNTSVHLARRRAYDAQTGRFLGLDPLGLGGGLHRSLYASGDPVNRRDPLGLSDCGGGGLPDLDPERIEKLPPAIIEGPEGGPATPFGPGVAVSYVNQAAGDKTFQEKMDKWYSDYLVAMNAGIFSGSDNPPDDTDASSGRNSGHGRAGGFGGWAAMDVAIIVPPAPESTPTTTTTPAPTTPAPTTPAPTTPTPGPPPGDPETSSEDPHQDSRSTIAESGSSQAPPAIVHFVEIDAYNRSPFQRLKQLLDAFADSQLDPLHLQEDQPKPPPPSGAPVEVDGYFPRYAVDPTAYVGRTLPDPEPIDPSQLHGRSLEDVLAEKWSAEASSPADLVEQLTQEPPPLDDVITLLTMALPLAGGAKSGVTLQRALTAADLGLLDDAIVQGTLMIRNGKATATIQYLGKPPQGLGPGLLGIRTALARTARTEGATSLRIETTRIIEESGRLRDILTSKTVGFAERPNGTTWWETTLQ